MKTKLFTLLLGMICGAAAAQPKPNIGFVYPCGVQQGTTVDVTVGGQNLDRITGATVSGTGVTAELVVEKKTQNGPKKISKKNIGEEDNLQLAQRIKVRITVAPGAEPGLRDFRLESESGLSNRMFFEVGQLPDFREEEANDDLSQANAIPSLPCTVNGQIMRSDRDCFSFRAEKGQTIVARMQGRRFIPYIADAVPGWFQPVAALYDAQGKEVAYCDDYFFDVDPVIVFPVPRSGKYTLKVWDALYRGREDFVYRIDLGEIPFVASISPIGGQAGKPVDVTVRGVNLDTNTLTIIPPKDRQRIDVRQAGRGLLSNPVAFEIGSSAEQQENSAAGQQWNRQVLQIGGVMNGCVSMPGEQDFYAVDVEAGQSFIFEIMARRLGSPLDGALALFGPSLVKITEGDDAEDQSEGLMTHHADPSLMYRFKKAGRYYIRVSDVQGKGGDEYAYRLKVIEPQPDFALRIDPSTLSVPRRGSAPFTVFALRKHKFAGEIEISFKGLPKDYTVSHNVLSRGESRLTMTVSAPEDAQEGKLDIRVFGTAKSDKGKKVVREAEPVESMMQAFYYTHLVPTDEFRVETAPPLPFSLTVETGKQPLQMQAAKPLNIRVKIEREKDYNEPIVLMLRGGQRGILNATAVTVEPDQDEAVFQIEALRWKPSQIIPIVIQGVVRGTSNRIAGQARNAFTASVTAFAPLIRVAAPAERPEDNGKK